MKRLRWLSLLMGITILGITGFQLYWLQQNYAREEKSLTIKAQVSFRETIQHLQVAKLKLDGLPMDTLNKGKVKVFMSDGDDEQVNVHFTPRDEIVSTINVIREKMNDSLKKRPGLKKGMIISMNNITMTHGKNDSVKFNDRIPDPRSDHFYRLLYDVDSLQDSLKIREINKAYDDALQDQKLDVPFQVTRLDTSEVNGPVFNEVTVGFVNPITYRLQLGNTFPYLIKRLRLPILFSLLLLGITLLSFVLLYKTLLKQQRLAELKNDFISNITHELKTPIATVGVAIEALKNFNAMQDPQRTKEYLDISSNELERLNLLVDKVLKLSMFEKKEIELKKEWFDCRKLAEEVMNSMKLQFEKYGAVARLQTEGDQFLIEADKLHITSVIYNLLDNALKYGKEKPVITVRLKSKEQHIELSVEDNGIGIPAEHKKKIFDKFYRVPTGDTHNAKGYGLGLSYVSEVLKRHHGFITVESEVGRGSIFTAYIPYKELPVIQFDEKRKMRVISKKIF
jgi:two-component system, OmpR family, phosphate regulon sensor histidine kinase PhoR